MRRVLFVATGLLLSTLPCFGQLPKDYIIPAWDVTEGRTPEDYHRDSAECQREAGIAKMSMSPAPPREQQERYISCMKAKRYKPLER